MKRKVYLYGLKVFAQCALTLASVSITQCSLGIIYQIPVDKELRGRIVECQKKSRVES